MLRLAALLILLVGASFWMLSGLLARYVSSASEEHSARVASFHVAAKGAKGNPEVDSGSAVPSAVYEIFLENHSEVAVSYDVVVAFEDALPEGAKVTLEESTPSIISEDKKTLTFSAAGTLAASSGAPVKETIELKFSTDEATVAALSNVSGNKLSSQFQVTVNFVQID